MGKPIDYTLYLVTDGALARGRRILDVVCQAVAGGVSVVQVREKATATREFVALAREMRGWLRSQRIPLIVNDRLDVAQAVGADGVHVGQDDMPADIARRILGPQWIIGVSVSTVDEARTAEADGADYLGVSPVFDTPTKTDTATATGVAGLKAIRAATALPLVGIGGLNSTNVHDVVSAGADGVAVVSAIMSADDPAAAARELRMTIDRGRSPA